MRQNREVPKNWTRSLVPAAAPPFLAGGLAVATDIE